jgi:hypothetical protein
MPDEYITRIMLAHEHGLIDRGALRHIIIEHDDDCPCPEGPCHCEADVYLLTPQGKVRITADGYLEKKEKKETSP